MKKKTEQAENTAKVDTSPKLTVTETVALQLKQKSDPSFYASYHQAATTEDLWAFVDAAERRFGRPVSVQITEGRLSATRTEAA